MGGPASATLHLGGYETFDALPGIVDGLDSRGYDHVTLDELP